MTSDLPVEDAAQPVTPRRPVRWVVAIMGGNDEGGALGPPRPGAPVVRVRTYNLMGGTTIWRLPSQARGKSLKESRRLAKAAERGRLGS